jgi:hypothetical protein
MVCLMATNQPRLCTVCVAEVDEEERPAGMVGKEHLPCAVCDEPTCLDHGRDFRTGFEHPECHESPDFTRADDGEY